MADGCGSIINVGSTAHPYFLSLVLEGVWGFDSVEFDNWVLLEPGLPVLLYLEHRGVWGVWVEAVLQEKFPNVFPVSYWFRKPYSRPFQLRLKYVLPERLDEEALDVVRPIKPRELVEFGLHFDRHRKWELKVFSKDKPDELKVFEAIRWELRRRNEALDGSHGRTNP